jgi:hypothetical protein
MLTALCRKAGGAARSLIMPDPLRLWWAYASPGSALLGINAYRRNIKQHAQPESLIAAYLLMTFAFVLSFSFTAKHLNQNYA